MEVVTSLNEFVPVEVNVVGKWNVSVFVGWVPFRNLFVTINQIHEEVCQLREEVSQLRDAVSQVCGQIQNLASSIDRLILAVGNKYSCTIL